MANKYVFKYRLKDDDDGDCDKRRETDTHTVPCTGSGDRESALPDHASMSR